MNRIKRRFNTSEHNLQIIEDLKTNSQDLYSEYFGHRFEDPNRPFTDLLFFENCIEPANYLFSVQVDSQRISVQYYYDKRSTEPLKQFLADLSDRIQ